MDRRLAPLTQCVLAALVSGTLAGGSARAGETAFGGAIDTAAFAKRATPAVLKPGRSTEPTTALSPTSTRTAVRPALPRAFNTTNVDGRFLRYRELLGEVAAAKDSAGAAYDARERTALFASVADLARLEHDLDGMERALDAQRARLAWLQRDFASRQRTELDVVVTGAAREGRVDSLVVTLEDGTRSTAAVNGTQRESLRHGATLEVFRGLVEPRPQEIDFALFGEGWSSVGHGTIALEPARDRVTFLKLDLTQAQPARGIGSVMAGTWTLDPGLPTADADRDRP